MSTTNAQAVASKGAQVTQFHRDAFKLCDAGRKAVGTMMEKMQALLVSKYGKVSPTYEQAKADRLAFGALADEKGLKDIQWLRKPYNAAIHAVYGALPVSTSADAQRKAKDKAPKAGAKKGETAPRRQSEPETLEQYITRVGVFKVLQQCALILECDDSTRTLAETIKHLKVA